MKTAQLVAVGFCAAAAMTGGGFVASEPASGKATATSMAIGMVETKDYRVRVTTEKTGGGPAIPTAAVTVTTYERVTGSWRRVGARRLPGTYFWNTVTGPRAICRLEVRTSGAKANFRPYAAVQLLVSPSLGCGAERRYALAKAAS